MGTLNDFGLNPHPVLYVAWCETSTGRYREQIDLAASIAKAEPRRGGFRGGATGGNTGIPVYVPGQDAGYAVERVMSE